MERVERKKGVSHSNLGKPNVSLVMYTLIIEVQDSTKLETWETQIWMDQKNEQEIQLSSQSLSMDSQASNTNSNETIRYRVFSD